MFDQNSNQQKPCINETGSIFQSMAIASPPPLPLVSIDKIHDPDYQTSPPNSSILTTWKGSIAIASPLPSVLVGLIATELGSFQANPPKKHHVSDRLGETYLVVGLVGNLHRVGGGGKNIYDELSPQINN